MSGAQRRRLSIDATLREQPNCPFSMSPHLARSILPLFATCIGGVYIAVTHFLIS
jgi:hypothetical protein